VAASYQQVTDVSAGRRPTKSRQELGLPKKKLSITEGDPRLQPAPQTDAPETGWSIDEMLMTPANRPNEMLETDDLSR